MILSAAFASLTPGLAALNVVTTSGGRATASPAGSRFPSGTVVTLTAMADPDQEFVGWAGDVTDTNPTVQLTAVGSKTVRANFTRRPRLVLPACGFDPDGFRVQLLGEPGTIFDLERSVDLHSWAMDRPITNLWGTVQVELGRESTGRFYRVRLSP